MPLSKVLFDDTIELHLDMEMVAIQSRATIIKLLQNLEKELIAKVADGVSDWSKARIAKQLSEADAIIRQYYDDAAGIARDTTTSVAQVSASATATSLSAAVGGQVAIGVLPTAAYLETLAGNTIIQGAVQADWWERQAGDTAFKFQSAVRQGLVAAETTPQIVRRVRDVMDISKRNAETLVHTSVQSVANTTREKIFADNDDVMSGKEWSSALDRKTCPTCGALDGKRWTTDGKPIKHSMVYQIPPKHFRCRCSMVPVLKTWAELGINMDELPDGTRASMEGQVNDKTFEDWLKRKTESDPTFADRTLGKGRAELWRNGKITMDQMISGGQPLTLSELKGKYGAPAKNINTLPITYHGKVSKNFKSEVNSAISGIPDNVLKVLNNGGTKITACLRITDAYPELKGVRPRGWSKGSTWDNCEGFARGRNVTVSQTKRISTGEFIDSNRIGGVIRHEAGHAFDAVLSEISSSPDYILAYTKDISSLKKAKDYKSYSYLTQKGIAGRQETFAEVFAELCGGHSGGGSPVSAFPNTAQIIKKIILGA